MLDYMELVEGKRKVVCDAFKSDKDSIVHNSFWLYEDGKILMLATMNYTNFISYETKAFKSIRCCEFFNTFLANGLDDLTIKDMSELINTKNNSRKNKWDFALIMNEDIEITYELNNVLDISILYRLYEIHVF